MQNQREKIDALDKQIVALLEQRMEIVEEIIRIKKEKNLDVFDQNREQKVINKIGEYVTKPEYKEVIQETYQHVMDASKNYQNKKI